MLEPPPLTQFCSTFPKSRLQSVMLNKNRFTHHQASQYIVLHGLNVYKEESRVDWYHFHLENPFTLTNQGCKHFRILQIIPNEIEYVIALWNTSTSPTVEFNKVFS